jgi:hypothetical protein
VTGAPQVGASVADMNSARSQAQRLRAEWLLSINAGLLTLPELVEFAATPDGAALRSIRLRGLLMSQPRWGETRADAVLSALRAVLYLPADIPLAKLAVGWLLDNRSADGRRFDAFLDVTGTDRIAPWRGFPFSENPAAPAAFG